VEIIENKLNSIKCSKGIKIYNKFEQVIEKNLGLKNTIRYFKKFQKITMDNLPENFSYDDLL